MRFSGLLTVAGSVIAACLLAASCTGGSAVSDELTQEQTQLQPQLQQEGQRTGVPEPLALDSPLEMLQQLGPKRAISAAAGDLFAYGSEYADTLPNQNINANPGTSDRLIFEGNYNGTGLFEDLAYAVFAFDMTGFEGTGTIRFEWQDRDRNLSDFYVAPANQQLNRWQWHSNLENNELLEIGDFTPYLRGSDGCMLVAVAYTAMDDYATLQAISVGYGWQRNFVAEQEDQLYNRYDLAIIDGKPAIAYVYSVFGGSFETTVHYTSATNAEGTAWTAPVQLAGPYENGTAISVLVGISLLEVDGNPAVAYLHQTKDGNNKRNGDLHFLRATDPAGSNWPAPVVVDDVEVNDLEMAGLRPSMKTINGNPAIAYFSQEADTEIDTLRYVRATDASGSAWPAPQDLDTGTVTSYSRITLETIAGNPAISCAANFGPGDGNDVFFIRASDVNGASWAAAQEVMDGGSEFLATEPFLVEIDGKAGIIYEPEDRRSLFFVKASDAEGTAWGAPVVVYDDPEDDFTPGGAIAHDVAWHNGRLHIAVYAPDVLRSSFLLSAEDALGNNWGDPLHLDFNSAGADGVDLLSTPLGLCASYHDSNDYENERIYYSLLPDETE